ncbi:hypothetical protein LguiB_025351 [Lonicera macranthoides]
MFGGTTQSQPQPQHPQSHLQSPTPTETKSTPDQEQALRRNTDCVYFLASPLTCKKGSECEYRHSDVVRLNPRDCWFWLHSNCLNPKCTFRHPPLDGLPGIQVPTPVGQSLPPPQVAATPAGPTHVSGKQGVACIFFQKGFCLKGDRCPFFHAHLSPYAPNKVAQSALVTLVNESPHLQKAFVGLEKTTQELKVPLTVPKPVELPPQGKPVPKVETALSKNGVATDKYVPPPSHLDDEPRSYRPKNIPHPTQGDLINKSIHIHQTQVLDDNGIPNDKDVDEFSREPSPGFDVLVEDDLRDSDYYPNEDQFGRMRGHEGRNLDPLNDYDIGRSADYNSMVDADRVVYRDPNGYDSYERQYAWEEDKVLSERKFGRPAPKERKRYPRVDSPDRIEESDLRHLLAKQRRGNGLRSVISRDHAHEGNEEDRSYRAPRRDTHHLRPQENSVSSRLHGRIKMRGRSESPDSRELERGRNWGRLSPGRPQITSLQGGLRDRINGRVEQDFNNVGRNLRGLRVRRDVINEDSFTEFNGAKCLGELKVAQNGEIDKLTLGKRKFPKVEDHQQSDVDLSFEGPKPLSEILKRKRGSEYSEDGDQKQRKENLKDVANQEQSKSASRVVSAENMKPIEGEGQSSYLKRIVSDVGSEEGMIHDETMEGHGEAEAYEQKAGDSEEEPVDEEDYNIEGGGNEEEYLDDDDDDDDFAKKMGVMYS